MHTRTAPRWLGAAGLASALACATDIGHAAPGEPDAAAVQALQLHADLCRSDAGHLWGRSLCGPVLLVDRSSRHVVANTNTPDGALRQEGDAFTGTLPANVSIANTSLEWQGVRWAMVELPLPATPDEQATLLIHETFHRVQPDLFALTPAPLPVHLDGIDGRTSLRLEWQALGQALAGRGEARRAQIIRALAWRVWRRAQAAGAAEKENALELNEGLAEYTARRVAGSDHAVEGVREMLRQFDGRANFVRSFAYASGPAYGLLLDELRPGWRSALTPQSDLGDLLWKAVGSPVLPVADLAHQDAAFASVRSAEEARASARAAAAQRWRAILVKAPHTALPLHRMRIEFNPSTVTSLEPFGIVYPSAVIRDEWGSLSARGGALVAGDGKSLAVPGLGAPVGNEVRGEGWTLQLATGWTLVHSPNGARVVRMAAP